MEIDWSDISARYREIHAVRASGRDVRDRIKPKIFQYDYLCLSTLAADVATLIADVPSYAGGAVALDLGCGKSPYRQLIEIRGFRIQTMDIDRNSNADLCGSVEQTGLPDESLDLVICTQVLEHSLDPGKGLQEIFRILRPGGYLIASAPHIWFYHPHPSDNWRFTQEGLTRLITAAGLEPKKLLSQGGSALSYFQIVNFLLFGIFGKLGMPFYMINNLAGKFADYLFTDSLFCMNFAILARKPPQPVGRAG